MQARVSPVWPNFLIIGAAKSGTTSLYHYLDQHPQIFMSPMKGPRFFAMEGQQPAFTGPQDDVVNSRTITTAASYLELFRGATDERAIGEASDWYLSSVDAPGRIQKYIPDVRLIAVLRQPADRAFSSYMHFARNGFEPLPFEDALAAEDERIAAGWSPLFAHRGRGFYAAQLKRYFAHFDREQIRVYLYDDLERDPAALVRDIFGFLDVDPTFAPATDVVFNKSGIPKSGFVHRFLTEPSAMKDAVKAVMPRQLRKRLKASVQSRNLADQRVPPRLRRKLTAEYRDDILELQDLLHRDLRHWLDA
jgi:hypothetical protein